MSRPTGTASLRNDEAATTGSPFSGGVGTDTTHQAGQFSTGVFGAGSGELNGRGEYAGFYNTGSGVWMDFEPEGHSYTLLIPMKNMGDTFRIFTRATEGDTPIADLVGSPFTANGFLNSDGIAGPADGCVELFQVDPSLVGDGTAPAAVEDPTVRPAPGHTTHPGLRPIRGSKEVSLDPIPGTVDGDGHVFRMPLSRDGAYRFGSLSLFADPNNDGVADGPPIHEGLNTNSFWNASAMAKRWLVSERGRGHLLGSLNCARDTFWGVTSDACSRIGERPDVWADPAGERRYELDDTLETLFGIEHAVLTPGGDDVFSTCTVSDGEGAPVFAVNWFRHRVSAEQAEEIALGLAREDCTVAPLEGATFGLGWHRSCVGEQPSEAVFAADRETGFALFTQTPHVDSLFLDRTRDFPVRFHLVDSDFDGISDAEDDDVDDDGIPNDDDPDWDNDGIPNRQDRHPLNADIS